MRRIDSIIVMALLFSSLFMFTFTIQPVKAQGTIYIMPDGSINPSTANITTSDRVTYTFTGDNSLPIVVQRDNIVIDGNGYTLQLSGTEDGFFLMGRSNVAIINTIITNCHFGIWLYYSSNCRISGNTVTNNEDGILLYTSSGNTVSENTVTLNNLQGIWLIFDSDSNTISDNNVEQNTVSKNPYGGGICVDISSDNNMITGNEVHYNRRKAIEIYGSSHYNTIIGNNVSDGSDLLEVWEAPDNTVIGNNLTRAQWNGIIVYGTTNIEVIGNTVTEVIGPQFYPEGAYGISIEHCSNITVSGNSASANSGDGIYFDQTSSSRVVGNTVAENDYSGIEFVNSPNNIIDSNRIEDNSAGIRFNNADNSVVYHNDFIDNNVQVSIDSASTGNAWNDTYPSGGNYWSDYTGVDEKSGPYQNVIGSDGIGDTPYIIDALNRDNYPLMPSLGLSVSILPISTTLDVGQSQMFTASVSGGTGPFSYQWYVKGATVPGATASTFTYTASASDVGLVAIYVRVTDSASVPVTAQSNTATVTVNSALTFSDDFESGNFSKWTFQVGATIDTVAHLGTYSAKATNVNQGVCRRDLAPTQTTVFARAYYRFDTINEINWNLHRLTTLSETIDYGVIAQVQLMKAAGAAGIFNWRLIGMNGAVQEAVLSANFVLDPAHWYCIELKGVISATAGEYRLYVDGVETLSLTGKNSTNYGNIGDVLVGLYWATTGVDTLHIDDVVVANQYIGPISAGN